MEAIVEAQLLRERLVEHERALRSHQNTLAPVNRIPIELLSRIFSYCAPLDSPPFYGFIKKSPPSFDFSRVCRKWRSVALGDATLWVHPTCDNRFMAQQLPLRARGAPLRVHMNCVESKSTHKFDLARDLAKHFGSFSSVFVDARGIPELKKIVKEFTGPAPYLKWMKLASPSPGVIPYDRSWTLLPSASLFMNGCVFPLGAECIRNLKSLHLHGVSGDTSLRLYSVQDVLSMLRRNAGLQCLTLYNIMKKEGLTPQHAMRGEVVRLPILRSLDLGGDDSTALALLAHLDLPDLTYLGISHPRTKLWTQETIIPLTRFLQSHISSKGGSLCSLRCDNDTYGPKTIGFEHSMLADKSRDFELGIVYKDVCGHDAFPTIVKSLLSGTSLEDLTLLELSGSSIDGRGGDHRAFWQTFSRLPRLQKVDISFDSDSLSGFLGELHKEGTFAALSELTLQCVRVGEEMADTEQTGFQALASTLKHRGAEGLPNLKSVHLMDCYDDEDDELPSKRDLKKIPVPVHID